MLPLQKRHVFPLYQICLQQPQVPKVSRSSSAETFFSWLISGDLVVAFILGKIFFIKLFYLVTHYIFTHIEFYYCLSILLSVTSVLHIFLFLFSHWPQFDLLARQVLLTCRYKIVVPDEVSVYEHFFSIDTKMCPKNTLSTSSVIPMVCT